MKFRQEGESGVRQTSPGSIRPPDIEAQWDTNKLAQLIKEYSCISQVARPARIHHEHAMRLLR
jgi:hypothetical protein